MTPLFALGVMRRLMIHHHVDTPDQYLNKHTGARWPGQRSSFIADIYTYLWQQCKLLASSLQNQGHPGRDTIYNYLS